MMTRNRHTIARTVCLVPAVLALLLFTGVHAAEPAPPASQPTKPLTGAAMRTLDLALLPEGAAFGHILGRACADNAKVLGVKPDSARALVALQLPPDTTGLFGRGGGGGMGMGGGEWPANRIKLFVKLPAAVPNQRADEFLDGVVNSLAAQVERLARERVGLDGARDKVERSRAEWDHSRQVLRRHQDVIRETTGRVDASAEQLRAAAPKLEEERQRLKLEVIGKQARQDALAATIARLSKAAEARATNDPVAAELEKIVKARELAKERIQKLHDRGASSVSELAEADAPIAEARAKLLERRETVAQANGGELLSGLNRDLATVAVDLAEAQAKLAALEKQLERFVAVRDELDEVDDLRIKQDRLMKSLDEAEAEYRAARRNVPDAPIRVITSASMPPGDPRIEKEIGPAFDPDAANMGLPGH